MNVGHTARRHDVHVTRAWLDGGTRALVEAVGRLPDDALSGASLLPGWTRAHVVAHVARNAEALARLAVWARTGVENPMYPDAGSRDADIERTAGQPPAELRHDLAATAAELDLALDALDERAWRATVRAGAAGREVQASVVPWLRVREVWLHRVDLAEPDLAEPDLRADDGAGAGTDAARADAAGTDAARADAAGADPARADAARADASGADAAAALADAPGALVDELLADVAGTLSRDGTCPRLDLVASDRDGMVALGPTGGGRTVVAGAAAELLLWAAGRSRGERLQVTGGGALPTLPRWL